MVVSRSRVRRLLCGLALTACGLLIATPRASAQDESRAAEKKLEDAAAQLKGLLVDLQKQEQALGGRQKAAEAGLSDLDALKAQLKKLQDEVMKKQAEVAAAEARIREQQARRALEGTFGATISALKAAEGRRLMLWSPDGKAITDLPPGVTVTQKDGKIIIEVPLPKESKPEAKPKPSVTGASTWEVVPSKPGEKSSGKLELEIKPSPPGAPAAGGGGFLRRSETAPAPKTSVEERISALEKKLNALLEELRALRKDQPEKKTGAAPKKEVEGRIIIVND